MSVRECAWHVRTTWLTERKTWCGQIELEWEKEESVLPMGWGRKIYMPFLELRNYCNEGTVLALVLGDSATNANVGLSVVL